ncbi:MAG: hypothetical protein QOG34_2469 [Frankiaceae bacterium]|nr:hypothetical protein [Frankiaceae bacterium]
MLTAMNDPGTLLAETRRQTGLSLRELAHLADVSFTTVARIESGAIDPTVGTLRRIMEAAGYNLRLVTEASPRQRPTLADLARATMATPSGERPDWTRLRALLDYLALHPDDVWRAITPRPQPTSRLMGALLAAITEKLADDHGLPRPGWTRTAPKMKPDWTAPGTARMRAEQRARTPHQLLERGLVIDERSLWRQRETVGA